MMLEDLWPKLTPERRTAVISELKRVRRSTPPIDTMAGRVVNADLAAHASDRGVPVAACSAALDGLMTRVERVQAGAPYDLLIHHNDGWLAWIGEDCIDSYIGVIREWFRAQVRIDAEIQALEEAI